MVKVTKKVICMVLLFLYFAIAIASEPSAKILTMIDRCTFTSMEEVGRYIQEYNVDTKQMTYYRSPFPNSYFVTGDTSNGAPLINEIENRYELYYWKNGEVSQLIDSVPKGSMDVVIAYYRGYFFGYDDHHFYRANSQEVIIMFEGPLPMWDAGFRPTVSPEGTLAFFNNSVWDEDKGCELSTIIDIVQFDGERLQIPITLNSPENSYNGLVRVNPALIWLDETTLLFFNGYEDLKSKTDPYALNQISHSELMRVDIISKNVEPMYDASGKIIIANRCEVLGFGNMSSDHKYAGLLSASYSFIQFDYEQDSYGLLNLEEGTFSIIYESNHGELNELGSEYPLQDSEVLQSSVVTIS